MQLVRTSGSSYTGKTTMDGALGFVVRGGKIKAGPSLRLPHGHCVSTGPQAAPLRMTHLAIANIADSVQDDTFNWCGRRRSTSDDTFSGATACGETGVVPSKLRT